MALHLEGSDLAYVVACCRLAARLNHPVVPVQERRAVERSAVPASGSLTWSQLRLRDEARAARGR